METNFSPFNARRNVSTTGFGHRVKFIRVLFRVFPFSRQHSRKRTAGGEFLFGTLSIYMGMIIAP